MCKNLIVVGVPPGKQKELLEFMFAMAPIMSLNDRDGLGFAAMTNKGLVMEHWLHPADAFKRRSKREYAYFNKPVEGANALHNIYADSDDALDQDYFSVVMHARMATTPISLRNVHPFLKEGVALIHNGIISNANWDLKIPKDHCDSEAILNSYVEHNVSKFPDKIVEVGKVVRGSYTCGVLTRNSEGTAVVDIFRSSPSLYGCFIKEFGGLVFCTSDTMVHTACEELGYHHSEFFKLKDDDMMRINAKTGKLISNHKFVSNGYVGHSSYNDSYSSRYYEDGEWHNWDRWRKKEEKKVEAAITVPTQEVTEVARANEEAQKKTHPKVLELAKLKGMSPMTLGPKECGKTSSPVSETTEAKDPFHVVGEGYKH